MSPDEERRFLDDLAADRRDPVRCDEDEIADGVTRGHVTLLVTALRHGSCLSELLDVAPGLDTAALSRAHTHVEALLSAALEAWSEVRAQPRRDTVSDLVGEVAKVLPVTALRLREALAGGQEIPVVVSAETARITVLRRHFDQLAAQLATSDDPEASSAMAREMYHPDGECLMQHPRFLPERVGELSPLRLARLLGEQPAGGDGNGAGDHEPVRLSPSVAAARARPGRGRH